MKCENENAGGIGTSSSYVKRALAEVVAGATAPVAVLEGAQGAGKTCMLKNEPAFRNYHYVSLADEGVFAQADAHLEEWIASLPRPAIIDEAHRVEGLLETVRRLAPQKRGKRPAFILATSFALQIEKADSPKPARFTLFPLTQAEIHERSGCVIDDLFDSVISSKYCSLHTRSDLRARMRIGGFPYAVTHPARALSRGRTQHLPFDDEVRMVAEENVGPGVSFEELIDRAILREVLTSPGIPLGVDALAGRCYVDGPTLTERLEAFREKFLIHRLTMLDRKKPRKPSFTKTRVHPIDTALAIKALFEADQDIASGPAVFSKVLRTLCVNQLVPAAQWASEPTECRHWRKFERRMREVDLVLLREDRLVGITVRNSLAARPDTIGALRFLAEDERFVRGFIIYMGKFPRRLTENIWALPVSALWEESAFVSDEPGLQGLQCPQGV